MSVLTLSASYKPKSKTAVLKTTYRGQLQIKQRCQTGTALENCTNKKTVVTDCPSLREKRQRTKHLTPFNYLIRPEAMMSNIKRWFNIALIQPQQKQKPNIKSFRGKMKSYFSSHFLSSQHFSLSDGYFQACECLVSFKKRSHLWYSHSYSSFYFLCQGCQWMLIVPRLMRILPLRAFVQSAEIPLMFKEIMS